MFKVNAVVALVGSVALAAPALASPVAVDDFVRLNSFGHGGYPTGPSQFRGELNLLANSVNSLFLPLPTSFISFCLEIDEPLIQGAAGGVPMPFRVDSITDRAIYGGVGPGGDPITSRTAFLFQNFTLGTLAGYDFAGPDRAASAIALQSVIWELEGEVADATDGISDPVVLAKINEFLTVDMGGFTGIGLVRVLNLQFAVNVGSISEGTRAQDVLVVIPLPHAAGMGMAGLLGLVGFSTVRRRR